MKCYKKVFTDQIFRHVSSPTFSKFHHLSSYLSRYQEISITSSPISPPLAQTLPLAYLKFHSLSYQLTFNASKYLLKFRIYKFSNQFTNCPSTSSYIFTKVPFSYQCITPSIPSNQLYFHLSNSLPSARSLPP